MAQVAKGASPFQTSMAKVIPRPCLSTALPGAERRSDSPVRPIVPPAGLESLDMNWGCAPVNTSRTGSRESYHSRNSLNPSPRRSRVAMKGRRSAAHAL